MFTCETCNYTTDVKCNYIKHLKTRKHLNMVKLYNNLHHQQSITYETTMMSQNEPKKSQKRAKMSQNEPKMSQYRMAEIQPQINQSQINQLNIKKVEHFVCSHCNKDFKTKANMRRHELHRCKANKNINNESKNITAQNDKEKKKLYKQIEKLLEDNGKVISCINGNNNNNNNNNTTNNIQQNNNIVINNYGDEDLSHITDTVLDNLIKAPGDMINNLTKMIHFNVDKPENMNMYIPSRKQKYIKVFKQNQWMLEKKHERIPDLIDRNYNIIDSYYEDCGGSDKLNKLSNKYYKNYQKLIDDKNEKVIKQEYDACELEILNNSDKVMNLHNIHK